ncbi:cold shock domain-containing protein [Saprospiraceae bacterium]|nr:cold shock domain-containing protein [Saprospiraceae bacterium]
MGRSQETFNKKEREKKKQKKKKEKAERRQQRKIDVEEGRNKQPQFMYLDDDGNLTTEQPDPLKKKVKIKLEDIEISIPKQDKDDTKDHRKIGIVKFFNREKGYGFINERDSRNSVFVHMDGLIDQIKENDKVIFEVRKGPKGLIAEGVKIYVEPPKVKPPPPVVEDKEGASEEE